VFKLVTTTVHSIFLITSLTGYYAIGPDLTLVAIKPPLPGQTSPVVQDIVYADLRCRKDRILNIRRLINLSGFIITLANVIPPSDAEFTVLER
jgi:hypothetical protein